MDNAAARLRTNGMKPGSPTQTKFTIAAGMALIAYVAVGLTAIRSYNAHWALAILCLTVFGLCTATLLAFRWRGAWAGFAVFGWAWFLISQPNHTPRSSELLTGQIITELTAAYIARPEPWSQSSGLNMACVAVGLLGAVVGHAIDRKIEAGGEGGRATT